jgi:hypothetical protein
VLDGFGLTHVDDLHSVLARIRCDENSGDGPIVLPTHCEKGERDFGCSVRRMQLEDEVVQGVGLPGVHRFRIGSPAADGPVLRRTLEGAKQSEIGARQVLGGKQGSGLRGRSRRTGGYAFSSATACHVSHSDPASLLDYARPWWKSLALELERRGRLLYWRPPPQDGFLQPSNATSYSEHTSYSQ